MRIAILADDRPSFIKPGAEGLGRMLDRLGVEHRIYYEGLELVRPIKRMRGGSPRERFWHLREYLKKQARFVRFMRELRQYDAVVHVINSPASFQGRFLRDRAVRKLLGPVPLLNYESKYILTCKGFVSFLKHGPENSDIKLQEDRAARLLDRYDWYLAISLVNSRPLPPNQPATQIGMDIDDGTLVVNPEEKQPFSALIDFAQPGHEAYRELQIEACTRTKTPFVVLEGRYEIPEIRAEYRKCSAYFLASNESFGYPVCEVQACGSYVLTPHADWLQGHKLRRPEEETDAGLSPNVLVYDNDLDKLCELLERTKRSYDPHHVRKTFSEVQPHFLHGDTEALAGVLAKIERGEITSRSHFGYKHLCDGYD